MWANTVPPRQLDEPSAESLAGRPSTHPAVLAARRAPYDDSGDLPDYDTAAEAEAAPGYNRELHEAPLYKYYLRAPDRKNLVAVPYGTSASSSYKMTARSRGLFSKKAEMEVWRTGASAPGPTRTLPSASTGAPAADEYVAGIWFDDDSTIPWCPRARFVHRGGRDDPGERTYRMEARNFSDWTVSVDAVRYTWLLEAKPFSLVLRASPTQETVARFDFSAYGLVATGGQEVGELAIYRHGLSSSRDGVDVILCSLVTATLQFKKMGRHYKNEGEVGAGSERVRAAAERVPLHRTGVAPFWTQIRTGGNDGQVDF